MVPTLVFTLLAANPAARFDAFVKAHPTFVATVEVSAGGQVRGIGTVRVHRPRRLRFEFKGSGMDYLLSSTESGYVELDRKERVYDEHPSLEDLRIYGSRLSGAPNLFPRFLLAPSVSRLFGAKNKPTVAAVQGGDELKATMQTPMGEFEMKLLVDAQGRPARYTERGPKGTYSWRLVSFAAGKPDLAAYRVEPPLGYVPFTLPELPQPLAVGQSAPLSGWRRTGKAVDLRDPQRGKRRLLAVLGADCPASRAVRPSLAKVGKAMPVFIIAPGEIVDPSGSLMKRLSPPGTPMFYMVGGDGKVTNLWFGFDAAKAAAWEAEIIAASKESAKG